MPNITEWKPAEKIHALVFGAFKSGKTVGAATFPRPVFLDFDSGIASVGSEWFGDTFGKRWVEYETITEKPASRDSKGVVTEPKAYDDACRAFDKWMKADRLNTFETWVIDSGTNLSEVAQNKAIYLMGGKMPGIKSETMANAKTHGLIVPKLQDFGAERSLVEQFIRMVKDSGKHVVLICHEQTLTNDAGMIEEIGPMFTGKSRQNIPLMFDEVYRLKLSRSGPAIKRSLMTQPDTISKVGSRLGVADGTEWTYDALLKSLQHKEK